MQTNNSAARRATYVGSPSHAEQKRRNDKAMKERMEKMAEQQRKQELETQRRQKLREARERKLAKEKAEKDAIAEPWRSRPGYSTLRFIVKNTNVTQVTVQRC